MCLAVPGLVQSIDAATPTSLMGKVSFEGLVRQVDLIFVPDVKVGEYVIVHVGMALSKVDPDEARKIIEDIKLIQGIAEEVA